MSSKFFKGPAYNVFSEDFALEVFKEVVVDNTTGSTGTAAGGGGATSVTVETDAFKSVSDGNTVQLSSSAAAPTLTVTPVGAISVDYTASSNTIQIGATEYVASGSDARIAYYDGAGNILSDTTGLFYEDVSRYLGVGVSSPTAFIHVSSSSDNAPLFRLSTPSAANMLIVTGSGLVGINTVPDAGKWLQVKDPDQNPRFYVSGDVYVAGSTDLKFDTDNRQIKNEGGSMRLNSHASHFIYLQDTASNVAIGMASSEDPTAKLHISGSDGDSLLKISSGPAGAEDLLEVSNAAVSASVAVSASDFCLPLHGKLIFNSDSDGLNYISAGDSDSMIKFVMNDNQVADFQDSSFVLRTSLFMLDGKELKFGNSDDFTLKFNTTTDRFEGFRHTTGAEETRFHITQTGDFGIGDADHSASALLHVSGSDGDSLLKISSGPAGAEDLLDVSNVAVSASVGISASAIVVDSDSGHDFQPSIRFSAGQTGFYAATADAIGVTLGGSRKYMIHGTRIESLDQNGGIYLKYATGAEDSPTYAFNGNTGTGMWATPATSDLHFSTNEVNRVTISSSGDVGIGTTAPTAKLHLSGSTDNAKLLHLSTPSVANALVVTGSGQVLISKELYFGDIGGEYITQNGDGNLQLYAAGGSIDITAPTIDLGNGGSPDTTLNFQGTNTGVIVWDQSEDRFLIKDDVTFEESVKFNTNVSISGSTDNAKLLHLSTPSVANALVVTGSGNVGINTDPITDSGVSLAVGGAKVYLPDEWVWGSDTDTMLRKRTSNNVEFRMAGSDILGISGNGVFVEAGNLGVGTLTAVHRVHVQDGDIGIVTNSADAASQKLIFTKSRHATDGSHTVIQDDDILGAIEFQGSDGDSFAPAASIVARVQGTPGDGDCPTELVFGTTANGAEAVSEHLHIMENGFIGINDAAPATRFAIEAGASNEELFGRHASSGIIAIRDEIYSTNGATRWFRGGSNQHVIGAGDDFGGVIFNETGASANDFRVESANYTHAIFVDSSLDRIGIRTDTPEASMHVNGNFHATIIVETSQRDLKKNIKPQTSQLNNIMMLNPVDFTWKEDNKVSKGFIADEVVEVYPELVQKNDAGKPIGIEYAKMVSVLTQGMKELNEIVNKQQETIEKLLKKIEDKD